MIEIIDKSKCTGCTACKSACPKACITMVEDSEGFLYPEVNEKLCVGCEICKKICPIIHNNPKNIVEKAYSAKSYDKEIQSISSSGGVFYSIATEFIENSSIFAAAFDDDFVLRHSEISNRDELIKYVGSKYLQSDLGNTFFAVEKRLKEEKFVIFIGTPCQVAGLKNFLKKDYSNLLTVDFICHGVPSPLVFKKYLCYISKDGIHNIQSVSFRDKTHGWEDFSFRVNYLNGDSTIIGKNHDLYLKAFFDNVFLRPSCYNCRFKSLNKYSDLTLADFWGVKKKNHSLYDENGVSVVLVNSKAGESIFELCSKNMNCSEISIEDVKSTNSALLSSAKNSITRKMFFKKMNKTSIDKNLSECLNPGIKTRIELKLLIGNKYGKEK
ncbi:MAG: Coenzyme F420 hydrogenase/dehydrogenase, beta subunit C-terminal domain [Clostridia bacterium]|nr:Coenzyme F420 hydrogenase/dehydrogenase, beta subunit C-terminal domain [Clostridia bacterium]